MALTIVPIIKLKQIDALSFGSTSGIVEGTIKSLVSSGLYIPQNNTLVNAITLFVLIVLIIAPIYFVLTKIWLKKSNNKLLLVLSYLVICLIFFTVGLQNFILHSGFLVERAAIFLIPLFFIFLFSFVIEIGGKVSTNLKYLLVLVLTSISLIYAISHVNIISVRDWFYDANTEQAFKEMINDIEKNSIEVKDIELITNWQFIQSFRYYLTTANLPLELSIVEQSNKNLLKGRYYYLLLEEIPSWAQIDQEEINYIFENTELEIVKTFPKTNTYLYRRAD